jgi:hypothetical protein
MIRVIAALVAAALVAAACGRAAEENVANVPAPGTPAPVAPPGPPVPVVPLIPHEKLATTVPDLEGWTHTTPSSATVSLPAPAAHVLTTYTRGRAQIDLEITDTGGHPDYIGSLSKVAGTSFSQIASNGYMKGTTLGGSPAVESWNHLDKLGDISILVDRRFIVHATGTGLDKIETLRTLVEKVDLKKVK